MRKRGYASLIWGGLLIIAGLLLLADNLDLLGDVKGSIWSLILGASGLLFLAIYISDREQRWALIPGLALVGIAVAIFLADQGLVPDYLVATIILAAVGLPFLLIFLSDPKQWWALIPALALAGSAAGVFLEGTGTISDEAVGGVIVGGIGLGFLAIYVIDREQWWALIPGGIMGIVAIGLLVATAAACIFPVALILLGLLLLRGALRGPRREPRPADIPSGPAAPYDLDIKPMETEKERLPGLEEQIAAAIAEEPETAEGEAVKEAETKEPPPAPKKPTEQAVTEEPETEGAEPPADMPPAPEMPEAPEVPPPPKME